MESVRWTSHWRTPSKSIVNITNTFVSTPLEISSGSRYSNPSCIPHKVGNFFIVFGATNTRCILVRGLLQGISCRYAALYYYVTPYQPWTPYMEATWRRKRFKIDANTHLVLYHDLARTDASITNDSNFIFRPKQVSFGIGKAYPIPDKNLKIKGSWQQPSLKIFLTRTTVVPYKQSSLRTQKTCRPQLALTRLSTTNRSTPSFYLWQNHRSLRYQCVLHLRRYASRKNSILRLQQQESQNATYLTKSILRSRTQFYAFSIPKPDSILLTCLWSPHNQNVLFTARKDAHPTNSHSTTFTNALEDILPCKFLRTMCLFLVPYHPQLSFHYVTWYIVHQSFFSGAFSSLN